MIYSVINWAERMNMTHKKTLCGYNNIYDSQKLTDLSLAYLGCCSQCKTVSYVWMWVYVLPCGVSVIYNYFHQHVSTTFPSFEYLPPDSGGWWHWTFPTVLAINCYLLCSLALTDLSPHYVWSTTPQEKVGERPMSLWDSWRKLVQAVLISQIHSNQSKAMFNKATCRKSI